MSLKLPKLIAPFCAIGVAVLIVSCGQQGGSPTAPSSVVRPDSRVGITEYTMTLADDAPADGVEQPVPPGSGPTPWPPGPPPIAQPGVPVPTPPSTHFRVHVKIDPESAMVPYSGVPVPLFSCRDNRHTWYYDQHLVTDTGIGVTFSERENFFDGRFTSKNGETIRIEGNSSVILHTRWCSAYSKPHYAQTRFKGKDDNGELITLSGPWVQLLSPQ